MLRLFETFDAGTDQEQEKEVTNYEEVNTLGMLGLVDLFQVSVSQSGPRSSRSAGGNQELEDEIDSRLQDQTYTLTSQAAQDRPEDATHFVNDREVIADITSCPKLLSGSRFTQPNLVEYQGRKALLFVFPDLMVKAEGEFMLHYRVFDIYGHANKVHTDSKIQAECIGGSFRVYSLKDFPGFQAATDLTRHLTRWGLRLHVREIEQTRGKKGGTERSLYTTEVLDVKRK